MEKRIAGIIKWLERCLKACRAGAMESALMDVECARADMERLRDEVWTGLERKYAPKPRVCPVAVPAKAFLLAMTVIALTATPAAQPRERSVRKTEEQATLEWVTPDEKTLLSNLRRHLSESNTAARTPREPEVFAGVRMTETPKKRAETKSRVILPEAEETKEESIPYDRIVSLVQTGERALKTDAPAIKMEK